MASFDHTLLDGGARFDEAVVPSTAPNRGKTMSKVRLDLKNKTPEEKSAFANTHHTAFAGSTFAANAVPTQAELATAKAELDAAVIEVDAARAALKNKMEVRDQKEATLSDILARRAKYAEAVSAGDAALLTAWGFTLATDPTPIGPLPMPQALVADASAKTGTIDLSWKSVRGASVYVVECSPQVLPRVWQQVKISSRPDYEATGLTTGQVDVFRVAAVGTEGHGPWSDETTKMAP